MEAKASPDAKGVLAVQELRLECSANSKILSPRERTSDSMTCEIPISALVSVSDNERYQILCKPAEECLTLSFPTVNRYEAVSLFLYRLARSVFVTKSAEISADDISEISSGLMEKTSRALRLVIRREPKPYRPHESEPAYLLCYVIEQLECGHSLTVYPQADPLIAKRRLCQKCQGLLEALPPKKPASSVRLKAAQEVA